MNCTLTLSIYSTDGTKQDITLNVDPASPVQSPKELVELLKQLGKLEELGNILSNSDLNLLILPLAATDISGDMVCNYSIHSAINSLFSENNAYLKQLAKLLDQNTYNIIITLNDSGINGFYKRRDGSYIGILPPNQSALLKFIKFQLAIKSLSNFEFNKATEELMQAVVKNLSSKKDKIEDLYIAATNNDIVSFLEIYMNSYFYENLLNNNDGNVEVHNFKKALENIIQGISLILPNQTNPLIKDFMLEYSKSNGKIKLETIKNLIKKYPSQNISSEDPLVFLLYINNNIEGFTYFDIKYILKNENTDEDEVYFYTTASIPLIQKMVLNADYYIQFNGTPVQFIELKNGLYLYRDSKGKYYVSDFFPIATNKLPKATDYVKAKERLENKSNTILNMHSADLLFNKGVTEIELYDSKDKPDHFMYVIKDVRDLKEPTTWNSQLGPFLKSNYLKAKSILKSYKIREQIIDSPYKLKIFLYLALRYLDNNPSSSILGALLAAAAKLNGLKDIVVYFSRSESQEGVKKGYIKYTLKKSQKKTNIYVPKVKSLKLDVIGLTESLAKKFGIKSHIVTTEDLKDSKFKGIDSHACAFILNKELYVNVDRAHTSNVLHEYSHLAFGVLKHNNFALYDKLIQAVDSLRNVPLYRYLFEAYAKSKRTRTDINEEVLADIFGRTAAVNLANTVFDASTVKEFEKAYLNGFSKVFGISSNNLPVSIIKETIATLKSKYGIENLFQENEDIAPYMHSHSIGNASFTSRKAARIMELLKQKNKLIENCL